MSKLSDILVTLSQQTGSGFELLNASHRARFLFSLRTDLQKIISQINNVYKPLVSSLHNDTALEYGISGNTIYSDIDATSGSGDLFWDSGLQRAKTIRETLTSMLVQINNLRSSIEITTTPFDSTDIDTAVSLGLSNISNITQVKNDAFSPTYVLDNDGSPNLAYTLAQHIDAIGQFFSGFPGVGTSGYTNTYPLLDLAINLSDVNIDTEVAQSTVTDLEDHLQNIRIFTGMDNATNINPNYSAHGSISYVTNGHSLEKSIQRLDAALLALTTESTHYYTVTLTGSSNANTGIIELTTDGNAPGSGNVITLSNNKAASLWADFIFTGIAGSGASAVPITMSGTALANALRISSLGITEAIATTMNLEGSIGSDPGEENYILIGSTGGGQASDPGVVNMMFTNNSSGLYLEYDSGLAGVWNGTIRCKAVVRMLVEDIG